MQCPRCHTESSGAFCPDCGAPLTGATCTGCAVELVPGARFCTRCGRAVRENASALPWIVAGGAIVALLLVILLPGFRATPPPGPAAGLTPGAAAPGGMDASRAPPLTGTPRDQADRLFNRVMAAEAAGDRAEVEFFLPMAVEAYRMAGNLDADGLYHLSILLDAAGEYRDALATAEHILASQPDHLLGLGAAARAARAEGDDEAAREYYRRLLDAYDAGESDPLPEYVHHDRILPEYRDEARAFLQSDHQ